VRTVDFQAAILAQRGSVDRVLEFSPSLRPAIESALPRTYASALDTVEQAGIPRNVFPRAPVFSLDELLDRAFWPASIFGGRAFVF
jgi:hypothetical protein